MITRRDALKSGIGGALSLLLPSWRQFQQRRQIDLTPFCDEDQWFGRRYDLSKPFAQDGRVYASDARIAIRTTLANVPELGESARLPAISSLPWWSVNAEWRPYPRQRLIPSKYAHADTCCPMCAGKGGLVGLAACKRCNGEGDIVPTHNDQWDETTWPDGRDFPRCPDCRGTGWTCTVLCDYCDGKGQTRRPTVQPVGDMLFAGHYDQKIRALGDLEYALVDDGARDGKIKILAFRGDGFEGLLMPLKR